MQENKQFRPTGVITVMAICCRSSIGQKELVLFEEAIRASEGREDSARTADSPLNERFYDH